MLTRDLISIEAGRDPGDSRRGRPADGEFAPRPAAALASQPAQHLAQVLLRRRRARSCSTASANCPSTTRPAPSCGILARSAREIAAQIGPRAEIVEFGAGSLRKVRLLLDALEQPARYLPIDISGEHLSRSAAASAARLPGARVQPVVADYTQPLAAAAAAAGRGPARRLLPRLDASATSRPTRRCTSCSARGQAAARRRACCWAPTWSRTRHVLHAAYNDAQGVTAAFNLNLLARANRELGTRLRAGAVRPQRLLQRAAAAHRDAPGQPRAPDRSRSAAERFEFEEGETLHTENSYKFTVDGLRALACGRASGRGRCGPTRTGFSACTGCTHRLRRAGDR